MASKNTDMKEINLFSFKEPSISYEIWKLESELLQDNKPTNRSIPGFFIEAQYSYKNLYLLVTSWNSSYEDSLEILLLSDDLQVLNKRHIGQIYSSVVLESHEVLAEDQIIIHCNNEIDLEITAKSGLLFSYPPILLVKMRNRALTTTNNI